MPWPKGESGWHPPEQNTPKTTTSRTNKPQSKKTQSRKLQSKKFRSKKNQLSNPHSKTRTPNAPLTLQDYVCASGSELNNPPHFLDIKMAKEWINACNDDHGSHCKISTESHQTLPKEDNDNSSAGLHNPLWLIDVQEGRLKLGRHCGRYLALSYVWGVTPNGASTIETRRENLEKLQENGAFYRKDISQSIPQTIKDVLQLIQLLGERYLWIDRFCIIQDDHATKLVQIQSMASVYANAYLTIVASNGDAYQGLQGIPGVTDGRDIHSILNVPLEREESEPSTSRNITRRDRYQLKANTEVLKFSSTSLSHLLERSTWAKRAWTLQEQLFSKRAIYIFDACIVWECHCAVWHEYQSAKIFLDDSLTKQSRRGFNNILRSALHSGPNDSCTYNSAGETTPVQTVVKCHNKFANFTNKLQHSPPWPDFLEYSGLVRDYCARKLTHSRDAIAAFTGVTETLSRVFENGFIFGLPEMFFDVALLWHPGQYSVCHRRPANSASGFPSWSWVGWEFTEGSVDLGYWLSSYDYIQGSPKLGFTTIPIVEWHVISWGGQKRHVTSNVPNYRLYGQIGTKTLPVGWKREDEGFIHEYDSSTKFRFPIPVQDPVSLKPVQLPTDLPLLSFKTTGGTFDVVDVDFSERRFSYIVDRSYDKMGCLMWDCKERLVSKVELIAISKALISDKWSEQYLWGFNLIGLLNLEALSEFYFVLCVIWEAGIAYRMGLGVVKGNCWETGSAELDVILG